MIVCEKAVAMANDGAGEMKGVRNAQAMTSSKFRCHVTNGAAVSTSSTPSAAKNRSYRSKTGRLSSRNGFTRHSRRPRWETIAMSGPFRVPARRRSPPLGARGPLDEVNDRRGVQVEAHPYSGQSSRRAAICASISSDCGQGRSVRQGRGRGFAPPGAGECLNPHEDAAGVGQASRRGVAGHLV